MLCCEQISSRFGSTRGSFIGNGMCLIYIIELKEGEEMKKQRIVWPGLIAALLLLMILSGCSLFQPVISSGGVLDGNLNGVQHARVVTFHVTGKGLAPETAVSKGQAVLMAERAAVADGYRQLVEKIRGVYVDAYMKSGQGAVDYEMVRTYTQSWLRGAKIDSIVHGDYGITEANMSLRINFTRKNMIWWPTGIGGNVVADFRNPPNFIMPVGR